MKAIHINPPARPANAPHIKNPLVFFIVFEIDPQNTLFFVIDDFEVLHIPPLLQESGDLIFHLGGWYIDPLVLRITGISDSSQQIGYRIG